MHLNEEECAGGMVQSMQRNYAAAKGVQIKLTMEECVKSTGRNAAHTHVAVKDALNKPSKEECVGGMGRIAHEKSITFDFSGKFVQQ